MSEKQPLRTGEKQPPVGKRFQPGQSGNPGGRPKRKPITDALRQLLETPGPNGRTSWAEDLARVLVVTAIRGDLRAISEIADRVEGKPVQQLDLNRVAAAMENRTEAELLHFAEHGSWPEEAR